MIKYREIDEAYFEKYDKIPMIIQVKSILKLHKVEDGIGGIILKEIPVDEYVKDIGSYEEAIRYSDKFDLSNWTFFMAFDNELPIGAATVASKTKGIHMLDDRDDMSVLWDMRVDDKYKGQGVGTKLFEMSVEWSRSKKLKQMKIECQNNNVPACKFYKKQGAVLGEINEYAYYKDKDARDEVQLIWYLDL